jgi:hypothetical protein
MAYISQEKKAVIRDSLKKVVPKGWKWSLKIYNHSKIVMTITQAPVDLIQEMEDTAEKTYWSRSCDSRTPQPKPTSASVNQYYLSNQFDSSLPVMQEIKKAMMSADWFDNSDPMTDYFHTAYYYGIEIGRWDKPFVVSGE